MKSNIKDKLFVLLYLLKLAGCNFKRKWHENGWSCWAKKCNIIKCVYELNHTAHISTEAYSCLF